MEPTELAEVMRQWAEVAGDLLEVAPGASAAELVEYARSVAASPVAATVLAGLYAAKAQAVEPAAAPRKVFGARR